MQAVVSTDTTQRITPWCLEWQASGPLVVRKSCCTWSGIRLQFQLGSLALSVPVMMLAATAWSRWLWLRAWLRSSSMAAADSQ